MSPQIRFLNFNPTRDVREYVGRVIEELYGAAPSDADLITRLKQTGKDVWVEISLRSSRLCCTCSATAQTMSGSIEKVIGEIESQIGQWRASNSIKKLKESNVH